MEKRAAQLKVIKVFGALAIGVLAYCFLVAPIVKQGGYWENARDTFMSIGLGNCALLAGVAAMCVIVIKIRSKGEKAKKD